jgi:hypothetical protein
MSDITSKDLLRLFVAFVGPRGLPGGGRVSTKTLLTTEAERGASGERLQALLVESEQRNKPCFTDAELVRLSFALRR